MRLLLHFVATDIEERQAHFASLKPGKPAEGWLAEALGAAPESIRWYGTDDGSPSKQLKNKLSQANSAPGGLLVLSLMSSDALEKAKAALVERWLDNPEWPKRIACVALVHAGAIRSVVVRAESPLPARIGDRLFPEVEVVRARGTGSVPTDFDDGASSDPASLAEELCIEEHFLREWLELLRSKRALIFYGPPGTGKTYIARRLAEHLQPKHEFRRFVQLHPSYGYEQFFEGYVPAPSEGGGGLQLVKRDGPLRELARIAAANPTEPAILVLDEVNRGNLPNVFGELYFLIEYRGAEIGLMYSPLERFKLPETLSFIGTMNSADRSVAVLDQALRRRFYFVPLFPGEPPVSTMLRRFLEQHCPQMSYVADLLDRANDRLPRHLRIGPSHFMQPELDQRLLERIWSYSVLPSIAEQFFDREDELESLSLQALMAKASPV